MICKIQVVTLGEDGHQEMREITCLQRTDLKPETLGLTLAEGKMILKDLQQILVEGQVASFLLPKRPCPECEERTQLPRPSEGHFVDHENGDSLDNRRVNDKIRAARSCNGSRLRKTTPSGSASAPCRSAARRSARRRRTRLGDSVLMPLLSRGCHLGLHRLGFARHFGPGIA